MDAENRAFVIERLGGVDDLDGVIAVDEASFTRPWTRAMYESEFLNQETAYLFVLRLPECRVAGYIATWIVVDEIHVNNLAVRPEFRGRGLGGALLAFALADGERRGAPRALLEVRRSNEAARRLYERFGFALTGVRREYYSHPVEDALVLWREERTESRTTS